MDDEGEDRLAVEEFYLHLARMDIDIDLVTGQSDTDDRHRIVTWCHLSVIAIHDRFEQCSILDASIVHIDLAILCGAEGEIAITDDRIDMDGSVHSSLDLRVMQLSGSVLLEYRTDPLDRRSSRREIVEE